jgi:hypothetical protein
MTNKPRTPSGERPKENGCVCGHPESSHVPFPTCGDLGWYGCVECVKPTVCKFFIAAPTPSKPLKDPNSGVWRYKNPITTAALSEQTPKEPTPLGIKIITDESLPRGTAEFRNPDGTLAGRIVNLTAEPMTLALPAAPTPSDTPERI